jgi:hypothetical protein
MKVKKDPEALFWNCDFPVVIDGAHLPMNEAIKLANEDIGGIEDDYGKCVGVRYWWARYQFVSEDDYDDYNDDLEPGKDSLWYIHETTKRPNGICKKVTVLEFE